MDDLELVRTLASRAEDKNKLIEEEKELDAALSVAKLNAKRAKLARLNALDKAAKTEVEALDDREEDGRVASTALKAAQAIQDREEGKAAENQRIDLLSGGKEIAVNVISFKKNDSVND